MVDERFILLTEDEQTEDQTQEKRVTGELFITDKIRENANQPDRVQTLAVEDEKGFSFVIADGNLLTDREMGRVFEYYGAREDWKSLLLKWVDEPDFKKIPDPEMYREPIAYASYGKIDEQILYESILEVNKRLIGKGVGKEILDQMESMAKEKGYRFVTGEIESELVEHFLERGHFLLQEIKPEKQVEFNEAIALDTRHCRIHFCNPEDIEEYVQSEIIDMPIDQRVKNILGEE